MKQNSLKKDYEKFKDNLHQTMVSSFAQIPFGTDFKTSSVSVDLKKSTDG